MLPPRGSPFLAPAVFFAYVVACMSSSCYIILPTRCPNIARKWSIEAQLEANIGQHDPQDASRPSPGHPQSSQNLRKPNVFFKFFALQPFRQDVPKMAPRLAKKLPTWRQVAHLGCFLAPLGRKIPPTWPQLGSSWRLLGPSWLHLGPPRPGQKWPKRLADATWSQDGQVGTLW